MDYRKLSDQIKALGDPARMRILEQLPNVKKCSDVYNVSELAEELKIPQPTVSHHLKVLYQAGLVQSEKMCREVYYWIDQEAVDGIMNATNEIVKKGS